MAINPEHFTYLKNLAASRSGVLLEPRKAFIAEGRTCPSPKKQEWKRSPNSSKM